MSIPNPYIFAIRFYDTVSVRSQHALIAQRLTDAGFDVGPMLWTASPHDYTAKERVEKWREAFARAGITSIDRADDTTKERTWYRVWHTLSQVEPNATHPPAAPAPTT